MLPSVHRLKGVALAMLSCALLPLTASAQGTVSGTVRSSGSIAYVS